MVSSLTTQHDMLSFYFILVFYILIVHSSAMPEISPSGQSVIVKAVMAPNCKENH